MTATMRYGDSGARDALRKDELERARCTAPGEKLRRALELMRLGIDLRVGGFAPPTPSLRTSRPPLPAVSGPNHGQPFGRSGDAEPLLGTDRWNRDAAAAVLVARVAGLAGGEVCLHDRTT